MRTLIALLLLCVPSIAAAQSGVDATEAPYFVVPGVDPATDPLPLREVAVHADISGVVASVTMTQLWENTGGSTLEATYVFPLSTRAAVHAMEMRVGGRRVVATIKEKETARQLYEDAKAAGKTAALLEQSRPNMFTTQVANVQPGDVIEVELKYVELLLPEDGIYSFVVPKVVGPRYVSPSEAFPDVPWSVIAKSDAPTPEPALHAWPISISLQGGVPVQWVHSSTHLVDTTTDEGTTEVELVQHPDAVDATADFVLDYALGDDDFSAGVLLQPDADGGGHFLALIAPPERVDPALVPPREYVFIVDTSGSMQGWPLAMATQLVSGLVDDLDGADRVNVLCFSGGEEIMAAQAVPATAANKARAKGFLAKQTGRGGTELLPALKRAFASPAKDDMARTFVVVTDGQVTVEAEAIDLIRERAADANVFAIGVGQGSVNQHLLDAVAHAGGGEPYVATNEVMAKDIAERFIDDVRAPVLTNIAFTFEGFDAYDLEPRSIPTLYASRPLLVTGRYRGAPTGTLIVSGDSGRGAWTSKTPIVGARHPAVPLLWARERIARLSDFAGAYDAPDHKAEVTQLGLDYALVTRHTSFIAVDDGDEVAAAPTAPAAHGDSGLSGLGFSGNGMGGGGMAYTGLGIGRGTKTESAGELSTGQRLTIAFDTVRDVPLREALKRSAAMMRTCMVHSPTSATGKLVWAVTLAADGSVASVKLTSSSLDAQLERCLVRQLFRLRVAGGARTVTFELSLAP